MCSPASNSYKSYYRARYYDPQGGRFLTEDPEGFDSGNNFYSYVENRPTVLVDPLGLDSYGWPIPGSQTPWPKKGSPAPRRQPYNCLAWSLGKTDQWMQPDAFGPDFGLIPYMKLHGRKVVPCDSPETCGKRHRVNTYQDPLNPWNWHAERQDCNRSWSSKYGEGPRAVGISDPDGDYQRHYGPVFNPKKTCWSCKGQ